MQERTPKKTKTKAAFTLEDARAEVLAKITKSGPKGAAPVTAATKEPKRSFYAQALAELEAERAIFVDRGAAKPKYLLIQFAPSLSAVAAKLEQMAAIKHPALLTDKELKKALTKLEMASASAAFELLEAGRRLVKLTRGKFVVFAHGDSLRAILGTGLPGGVEKAAFSPEPEAISAEAIRGSYDNLVRLTGFPGVEIAALQRQSGVPMEALKAWLLAEHREGRVVFGLGDWSLADDATRAGMIELRGDRNLVVEFKG